MMKVWKINTDDTFDDNNEGFEYGLIEDNNEGIFNYIEWFKTEQEREQVIKDNGFIALN